MDLEFTKAKNEKPKKRGRGRPRKNLVNTNKTKVKKSVKNKVDAVLVNEYNEVVTPAEPNGGMKYDTGKLDWSLLPWEVIETTVNRFTVGKDKYAKDSWKKLENGAERYESAMMRHFCEYKKGNTWDNDPKFKDHPSTHLQAMLWNAICLCWFELQKLNEDKSSNN